MPLGIVPSILSMGSRSMIFNLGFNGTILFVLMGKAVTSSLLYPLLGGTLGVWI